jgi:hypothetical protein
MSKSDVGDLMRKMLGEMGGPSVDGKSRDECGNSISAKEAFKRVKENAERYLSTNPWKPGDLVTARKGVNLKGAGTPHIVVDALPTYVYVDNVRHYQGGKGMDDHHLLNNDVGNGRPRLNTRVLSLRGDEVIPMWLEHWQLETYVPEDDEDKRH